MWSQKNMVYLCIYTMNLLSIRVGRIGFLMYFHMRMFESSIINVHLLVYCMIHNLTKGYYWSVHESVKLSHPLKQNTHTLPLYHCCPLESCIHLFQHFEAQKGCKSAPEILSLNRKLTSLPLTNFSSSNKSPLGIHPHPWLVHHAIIVINHIWLFSDGVRKASLMCM